LEFFFNLRGLPLPGQLFGQFGVATGQFLEAGMTLDRSGNEIQFVGGNTLAVVSAAFVALQQMVGALGEDAPSPLATVGLLAEMAADHRVDSSHLLKDLSSFLLERR
jgi:hypothetical protein